MAPQVPYNPVPQENLSGGSLSEQHPQASESTFGGDIARAISGLGKTVEGVGDQIYERATFLQDLHNKAEARKADADYIVKSGQISAQFNSLEGDQAVKAYPKYQQNLKALRESIRGSLSTSSSQEMYDGQTLGTLSRAIFSGASHTAAAQKKYVTDSMEAQRTAIREEAATYPQDDMSTQRAIRRTEQSVREEGKLRGQPPAEIDNAVRTYTSAIHATQIKSIAEESPLQGPTELERLRPKLTEKDYDRVKNIVDNRRDGYGSAKIATDLLAAHTDDDGNLTVSMAELQAKAKGLAEKFSPDDPAFGTKTIRALDAEFNQRKYARKVENYDSRDTVNSAILAGASNMDQLLADPKASAAYYRLPKSEQLKVPARIDNFIKARDRDFNERTMTTIMGLKNNDVEAFLNTEPTDEKYRLSQPQIRQVQAAQAKAKAQTAQDPRVDRAMGWLRAGFGPHMEALGVFRRTQGNKNDYDHLTGAVQQALDVWQEDHKKPPSTKEFNEQIAPQVLKVTKTPGAIFGGLWPNENVFFKHDTGSKEFKGFAAAAKEELRSRGGQEPTDEEIYKAYTRMQLLKLYPPKGGSNEPR